MSRGLIRSLEREGRRRVRRLRHAHRLRRDDACTVLGIDLVVPRGVPHPLAEGDARFFVRTVGPMVAPGQRVLVLDCGAGLDAVAAGLRGADVTARSEDPRAVVAAAANLARAEVSGVSEPGAGVAGGPWDLVLWRVRDPDRLPTVLDALPTALGDRGRLVLGIDVQGPAEARMHAALPDGFRAVELARNLGLSLRYRAWSLGVDLEARRRARHAARDARDKAAVSRRRWERGETDASQEEIARVMEHGS